MKIKIYSLILFLLFILLMDLFGESFYYFENFSSVPVGWNTNFRYGRDGILFPGSSTSALDFSTGVFALTGEVNSADANYNTFKVGRCGKYTNQSFTASETNPFGFTIKRTYAWLDAYGAETNYWQFSLATVWLFKETYITAENSKYDDYVCLYETKQCKSGGSRFGVYIGGDQNFDLGQAIRPNGDIINLTNSSIFSWEWNYLANLSGTSNTNNLGIMITHNGSVVKYYLNPDPDDKNAYPNEYCLVGTNNIGFYSNMRIMLGHECNMAYTDREDVSYDDLMIRSVASTIKSELELIKNEGNRVEYVLNIYPEFTKFDSGIGEIKLIKKNIKENWKIKAILADWGDLKNNGEISYFKAISSGEPKSGEVLIKHPNSDTLIIRFCQISDKINNVVNYSTGNKNIEIFFYMDNKGFPEPISNKNLSCFVNCRKYDDTHYSSFATTGDKRVVISLKDKNNYVSKNFVKSKIGL